VKDYPSQSKDWLFGPSSSYCTEIQDVQYVTKLSLVIDQG